MNQTQPVEQFGPYTLHRKIGQGGMAEVFLATLQGAPQEAAPVVIKRLHQDLEKNRDAVDLFLTEADVTLMMDHANVIRVHDAGEINGRYYMAMEYVHGKDLEQLFERCQIKNQPMDPDATAFIMAEVLRGLDYVHTFKAPSGRALGIVHRDVTPSNVYVSSQGKVKLGDFGVAKLIAMESWTMAGSVKGKLGYLSPEQVGGQQPAASIDLWAAAIIFYELLAGERVFVGENELDVMLRIRKGKVPRIRKVNKTVPKQLEVILKRALHKKEHKRYQTGGEFLKALESYIAGAPKKLTAESLVGYFTQALA